MFINQLSWNFVITSLNVHLELTTKYLSATLSALEMLPINTTFKIYHLLSFTTTRSISRVFDSGLDLF